MTVLQPSTSELLLPTPELALDQPSRLRFKRARDMRRRLLVSLERKASKRFSHCFRPNTKWSERRQLVHLPLFPGYVFVRIAPMLNTRVSVLRTKGVISFVGARSMGIPIPDSEIETVQAALDGGAVLDPYPYLTVGQRVRVCGGCLEGSPVFSWQSTATGS